MSFDLAVENISRWRKRPSLFVREVFGVVPDAWQDEVLDAFPHSPRIAMVACKGPGKTTVLAWLAWNFMGCYPAPLKIQATSITGDNLSDGLWSEMAKWQAKSEWLTRVFEWTATEIRSRETRTKFMSARAWPRSGNPQEQADTLAGFHEDRVMAILDESGGIPPPVLATAEAVLANMGEGKVAHIVQAGNPTQMDGCLYKSAIEQRQYWRVFEVTADPDDPMRTPRVSVEWARQQIEMYGADNPWVLVNIFGRFPPSGFTSLIAPDEVRDAMKRHYRIEQFDYAAKIVGVDVARFGDDSSVIFGRQGKMSFEPLQLRNQTAVNGAGRVARLSNEWQPSAIFIDDTGGYGGGWIDILRSLGYSQVVGVQFAGKSDDPRYFNKRTEMWFRMIEWIRAGGALPKADSLVAELCTPTYTFKNDKMALEEKAQIKARLGRSPDYGDALALTFAFDVAPPPSNLSAIPGASPLSLGGVGKVTTDYDPYSRE